MEKLKQEPIWVCWRYEAVKSRRTKVLYSVKGRRTGTSQKHSGDWATHAEALQAKDKGSFDGVGFVLPAGIVAIDLDHVGDDAPLATELAGRLKTYGERSPSGNGLHYIAAVDLSKIPQSGGKLSGEYYCKNPHNNMEIYFGGLTSRYMTFTGNAINEEPVTEQTAVIQSLLEQHMRKDRFKKAGSSGGEYDAIIREWKTLSCTLETRVQIRTLKNSVEGEAIDIDEFGALIVRKDDNTLERVIAGDCFHR